MLLYSGNDCATEDFIKSIPLPSQCYSDHSITSDNQVKSQSDYSDSYYYYTYYDIVAVPKKYILWSQGPFIPTNAPTSIPAASSSKGAAL
jgi:hypothetical protein